MSNEKTNLPATRRESESIFLDKALIIRSKEGAIQRLRTEVNLSTVDKTLVQIIKPYGDREGVWTPTATGYRLIGSRCGLAYDKPDTVIVNGVAQANPCWTDEDKTCYSRTRVGGYTELGQPVISDRTVEFSVHRYNVQDLLAKAQYAGKETPLFNILPYRGKDEHDVMMGAPEQGNWGGYRLDEAMVLWIRTDKNPDLFKWYKEINNRQKHALKTVQTFSDRNAVMAHPAIPSKRQFPQEFGKLSCALWFTKEGNITFNSIEEQKHLEIVTGEDDMEGKEEAPVIEAEAEISAESSEDVPDSAKQEEMDMGDGGYRQEGKDHRKQMIGFVNGLLANKKKEEEVTAGFKMVGLAKDLNIASLETETLEELNSCLVSVLENAKE